MSKLSLRFFSRDPDKRAHYDRFGGDPDSRFGRASTAPSFGGSGGSPFGPGFRAQGGGEVSPEDLFNMFFGGGGMGGSGFGGGFGGPGVQTFSFGPGGFRAANGFQQRRAGGGQRPGEPTPVWMQLIPILCLLGFMVISQLPNLFYTPPPPDPAYSFDPTVRHTLHRQTQNLKADY